MKILFTLIMGVATMIIANAQLVLTEMNTPHHAPYMDVRQIISDAVDVPVHGEGMIYNYSVVKSTLSDTIPYLPVTRTGFTQYTRFHYGYALLGQIPLYSEYYSVKDAAGIKRVGSYKLQQSLAIGNITGNPADTLYFPGNATHFAQPDMVIPFPASYGSSWTSNYTFTVDFNLTVTLFGLNKTPGLRIQHAVEIDSIVGEGNLVIPTANGISEPIPVLMVKRQINYIDSTFLNGNPAPAQLLAAFGLTQGAASQFNTYIFYGADFERPIMEIAMSEDWQTTGFSYYTSTGVMTSGVKDVTIKSATFYPNPIERTQTVTFETGNSDSEIRFEIFDLAGVNVDRQTLRSNADGTAFWQVPANMNNGMYFFNLTPFDTKASTYGKIMVK